MVLCRCRRPSRASASLALGFRARCCVAVVASGVGLRKGLDRSGGPSPVAASLWLRGGSVSERASTGAGGLSAVGSAGRGEVRARCCVAVAARRGVLRKGLDRSGGSRLGWVCGSRPRLFVCAGFTHDASFSWTVPREGSIVGTKWRPWRAVILLLRGTVGEKGESLPTRRAVAPLDARFCLRVLKPERCCVGDGIRTRTQHPSPLTHERRTLRPPSHAPRARRSPDPAAGRGPFGEQVDSQLQRRSSKERPNRSDAAANGGASRSDAAASEEPAGAT